MLRFLSRLFGGSSESPPAPSAPEHAVLVYLTLTGDDFGTEEERARVHALTDELEAAILRAGAGEFDGDEFGGGGCTLYMYGPHADPLWSAVGPILEASPLSRGGYAIKRYGGPEPGVAEERIDFEEQPPTSA